MARCCHGAFLGVRSRQDYAAVRFRALADGKMLAKCVPPASDSGEISLWRVFGLPAMARYRRDAFPGGDPWQLFRFMRSRRGLGREKRQFAAPYRRHVSKMSWLRQDIRAMHPKSPANGRSGMHRANILPRRGPFRCAGPSHHARREDLAIPRCSFERFDLFRAGAVLAVCAPPASCSRPSCARSCARSPSAPPAPCPRCWVCLPRRPRAASSRPHLCRRVRDEAETAGSCRLPQKTWRCDGVSLNCRCSAVLF